MVLRQTVELNILHLLDMLVSFLFLILKMQAVNYELLVPITCDNTQCDDGGGGGGGGQHSILPRDISFFNITFRSRHAAEVLFAKSLRHVWQIGVTLEKYGSFESHSSSRNIMTLHTLHCTHSCCIYKQVCNECLKVQSSWSGSGNNPGSSRHMLMHLYWVCTHKGLGHSMMPTDTFSCSHQDFLGSECGQEKSFSRSE